MNAYRTAMIEFAAMPTMEIWYDRMSEQDVMRAVDTAARSIERRRDKKIAKTSREGRTEDRREGALARQLAGALEARRAGRRRVPHRQPAADRRAVAARSPSASASRPTRSSR